MTDYIYGPTDESRQQLKRDFAMSSADCARRAIQAQKDGNTERARIFATVSRVADSVARGGAL